MTLTQMIFMAVVALVILVLVLFPSFRGKLKTLVGGFLNVFIEDKAKTPEGAKAIYQQAIEEAQEKYNKASETLRVVSGRHENAAKKLQKLKTDLKDTESKCETFVKANRMEEAALYAEKREELLGEISRAELMVTELNKAMKEATEISQHTEKTLKKLKQQSKTIVSEMEMKRQLAEMYDDLDEMKKTTSTSKLLESVQDGYEDLSVKAAGARTVHESKVSTKMQKAEKAAAKSSADAYLEQLKAKNNK